MIGIFSKKLKYFLTDKKFSEILTGSAFALVSKLVGAGLTLLVSILISRMYGAEMMGLLAIIQSFMMIASIFGVLGTNVSILRLIPEHVANFSTTSAFLVYRKTQYFVALTSLFVGGVLFLIAEPIAIKIFSKPHLSFYLAITALCLIFRALMDLNTQAVRGLRLIRTFSFMQILPQAAMLLVLLMLIALSRQPNDPIFAQLASWGLTAIVGIAIMDFTFRRRMQPQDVVQPVTLRELTALSAPMLMTASMNFVIVQIGILILGIYCPDSDVGHYAVAVKLATLTSFVLQAINSMAAPKFSELFHTGKLDELFYVAQKSTKLIFWTTTPILLFLIVMGLPILSLFGDDFTAAYLPMLIIVAGQFVNSVSGPTGYFMTMTGHQKIFRNIIAFASALSILLNFALIPWLGLYGAALAATVSRAAWNIWTLIYIKRKYGTTIYYIPFLKPKNPRLKDDGIKSD